MQAVAHFPWKRMKSKTPELAAGRGRESRTSDLELMLQRARQEAASLSTALDDARKQAQDARLMLREVDHRAKNSLQLAAATLQLQASEIGDPAARQQIFAAIQRLQSVAAIHAVLYKSADGHGVDMAVWLRRVCDGLAADPLISVSVDAPSVVWPVAVAGPVGLLAAEAVANALKHAFLDGAAGHVTVELRDLEDGCWRLSVSDDGIGGDIEPGLGMRLLRLFAEQLGGELEIRPGQGSCGLVVSTRFAVHAQAPPA